MRNFFSCSGGGLVYDVACLGDGANQLGIIGIPFQLISQPTDSCSEQLNIVAVFGSPHPAEELIGVNHILMWPAPIFEIRGEELHLITETSADEAYAVAKRSKLLSRVGNPSV